MQLKQLTLIGKTTLTTVIMTIVWSLISEMGGEVVSKINHHSENWSVISCELLLEGIAIFLMWLTYYRHPKIWAFADQQWQKRYLLGFLFGTIWFALSWSICVILGGFKVQFIGKFSNSVWFIVFLVGFAVQSMFEELICRGYIMGKFLELNLPKTAIIVNSLLFMLLHTGNDGFSLLAALDLVFFAFAMSLLRLQTHSLWVVGAFHAAWNFAEGVLFGTAVSGTTKQAIIFNSIRMPHKSLVNGGIFGVENSLVSVILDGILLLIIVGYVYRHHNYQQIDS